MWRVSISPGLTLLQHHCSYIPLWIKSLISKHSSVSFCSLVPNNKIPLKTLDWWAPRFIPTPRSLPPSISTSMAYWLLDRPQTPDQSAPGRQMLLAPRNHSMLQSRLFFPKHHILRVILALNILLTGSANIFCYKWVLWWCHFSCCNSWIFCVVVIFCMSIVMEKTKY